MKRIDSSPPQKHIQQTTIVVLRSIFQKWTIEFPQNTSIMILHEPPNHGVGANKTAAQAAWQAP